MYSKELMKPKDVYEKLKGELPRVLSKELSYRIRNSAQLELLGATDWSVEEMDGKNYASQFLLILAHETYSMDSYGTYFVIKVTPFNCYYGEAKQNSLHTSSGLESIPSKKDDDLTKFYREQMGQFWGERLYKLECRSYFDRARQYQKEKAQREYDKMLAEATKQIEADENILGK